MSILKHQSRPYHALPSRFLCVLTSNALLIGQRCQSKRQPSAQVSSDLRLPALSGSVVQRPILLLLRQDGRGTNGHRRGGRRGRCRRGELAVGGAAGLVRGGRPRRDRLRTVLRRRRSGLGRLGLTLTHSLSVLASVLSLLFRFWRFAD